MPNGTVSVLDVEPCADLEDHVQLVGVFNGVDTRKLIKGLDDAGFEVLSLSSGRALTAYLGKAIFIVNTMQTFCLTRLESESLGLQLLADIAHIADLTIEE